MFGTQSNFPAKYKSAFFILDWTFGRILAVHLHPKGASYTAQNDAAVPYHLTGPAKSDDVEEFLRGKGHAGHGAANSARTARCISPPAAAARRRALPGELHRAGGEQRGDRRRLAGGIGGEGRAGSARGIGRHARSRRSDKDVFAQWQLKAHAAEDYDRFIYFAARTRAEKLPLEQLRKLALEEPQVASQRR